MFETPQTKKEDEQPAETINKLLLDAIRGVIYEPHEQHVEYEEDMAYGEPRYEQSGDRSGGGSSSGGMFPLLLVGVALGAIGYLYGKRSGSGGEMMGETSERIQSATDRASERTEEIAGSTAETLRESGQQLSERTEEKAGQTADRIEETGEEFGDRIEEGGSEAADKVEDGD